MKVSLRLVQCWLAAFQLLATAAVAGERVDPLPRVLGPSAPQLAAKSDSASINTRVARPRIAALAAMASEHEATRSSPRFVIDLFDGVELEGEVVDAKTRPNGATLVVRLPEIELGTAVFTVESGLLTATVDFPGGSYVVSPQPEGLHLIAQNAVQLFPVERPPRIAFGPKRGRESLTSKSDVAPTPGDANRLIDIMVIWTPAAEAAAGGAGVMQNLAQAAIDSANASYLNSGIAHRLRLVHRQQVAYTERASCMFDVTAFECALDDLTGTSDGFIDDVHALRDVHGADLVALMIQNTQYCGIAWLPSTPYAESGFSVTAQGCAVANKSFAHELGHNMGANHDPAYAEPAGPKPYNHGYVSPAREWRTVMAYPGACSGCARIGFFSNPRLSYNGFAMGSAAVSNNAQVLNATGKAIAGYRPTSPLHPVAQRFDDVSESHLFFGEIEFFALAEITTGCGAGMYCPDAPVTRREIAAFLERALRASNWTPPAVVPLFTDVLPGSLFAGHIEALRADGITSGCSQTTFCPESPVTRAQMAALLLKAMCGAGYAPMPPATQMFVDVERSHPFAGYIGKMHSFGITDGCSASPLQYCPDAAVTRGQMAKFIERAYPFVTPSESCPL